MVFREWMYPVTNSLLISFAKTTSKPDVSKPRSRNPAPEKKEKIACLEELERGMKMRRR